MGDITNVDVPSVRRTEVDLAKEYGRVSEGLSRLKQEFSDAGDDLLAENIKVDPYGAEVRFHPKALDPMESESDEPFATKDRLRFCYKDNYAAMEGLQNFSIQPDGSLLESAFRRVGSVNKPDYKWVRVEPPPTADRLNTALTGLVGQHEALLADRLGHSVANVTVPSVGK